MPTHYPVMLAETLELLNIKPNGLYLDATAGLGGHTRAIAERLTAGGRLIANDRDEQSLAMAQRNAAEFADRIAFHHGAFSELRPTGFSGFDGLIADLGTSRFQLTDPERGFSFQSDGPLDMRMDTSRGVTAADLINHTAEKAIANWLHQYGEERRARKLAGAIVRARPIRSTRHLAGVVESARAPDGTDPSRNEDVSGIEDRGESRDGGDRRAAGSRTADGVSRRTDRHHFFSFARRQKS